MTLGMHTSRNRSESPAIPSAHQPNRIFPDNLSRRHWIIDPSSEGCFGEREEWTDTKHRSLPSLDLERKGLARFRQDPFEIGRGASPFFEDEALDLRDQSGGCRLIA